MKFTISILSAGGIAAAIMSAGAPDAAGQTVDTSTGTVSDSSASPSGPNPDTAAKRLTVTLMPTGAMSKAQGTIRFSMAGNAVNVTGRLDGLEPGKRYHVEIQDPKKEGMPLEEERVPPPQTEAAIPADVPAKPTASGRPGGTTQSSSTSSSGSIGSKADKKEEPEINSAGAAPEPIMVTADPKGAANVNSTLRNMQLASAKTGLLGKVVMVSLAPANDLPLERLPVAQGIVEVAAPASQAP